MTRIIWRRAHPVRLPDKDSQVHRELHEAYVADLCLKEVAQALEAMKLEERERINV